MEIQWLEAPTTSRRNSCAVWPRTIFQLWVPISGDRLRVVLFPRFLVLSAVLTLSAALLPAEPPVPVRQASDSSTSSQAPTATAKPKPNAAPSKASSSKTTHRTTAAKRHRRSPRVQRIHQAFVASASLKPMAQQLLQDRTAAGYAGVEAYARRHAKEDAGALAWLVVGYAHVLDHDYAKAIDPLNRAKPRGGDLGDYITYYLGTSYLQTARQGEALATLADFENTYPDSLLIRDAHLSYAGALLTEGRAAEAVDLLEKDRLPARSDIEFTLGKAYAAIGQNAKAGEIFANIYYSMPTSAEADGAYAELRKLPV